MEGTVKTLNFFHFVILKDVLRMIKFNNYIAQINIEIVNYNYWNVLVTNTNVTLLILKILSHGL